MQEELVRGMNAAQKEATLAPPSPLLVLAGAGSGKTRVLTHRIAHMVQDVGIGPTGVLAITFTNKAAQEMRERLHALLGHVAYKMWISTFHSMCVRILRAEAEHLGFSKNFVVYDTDDAKRLVRSVLRTFNFIEAGVQEKKVLGDISAYKNGPYAHNFLYVPEHFTRRSSGLSAHELASVTKVYDEELKRANAMDFDNLLLNTYELFQTNGELLQTYQNRFGFLAVDEYQDTNHLQFLLVHLLAHKDDANITVVGDDDQAIYSWRGSDISNILNFESHYPNARIVKLEQNYRSTGHILAAANAVVSNNSTHREKHLFTDAGDGERIQSYLAGDDREEGRWIAMEIARLHQAGVSYNDIAVFYRMNSQSRILEDMILRAGMPYKMPSGRKFLQRAEIQDAMAYLKLLINPQDDVSASRVINTPRRGIGKTTQDKLRTYARTHHMSLFEAAQVFADPKLPEHKTIPKKTHAGLLAWTQALQIAAMAEGSLPRIVELVLDESGYFASLKEDESIEALSKMKNLEEFVRMAQEYEADNAELNQSDMLVHYMEWLALQGDIDTLDDTSDAITLMTVHTAKGLEFDAVFVTGLEEGVFPLIRSGEDESDIEEERRLAYVAFTRARKQLFLTHAAKRMLNGDIATTSPSRFLREIPAEHIEQKGIGSRGFSGFANDKRGSRRGMYGTGVPEEAGMAHGRGVQSEEKPPPLLDLAVGDRVHHRAFGNGVVIEVVRDEVQIAFDTGLVKRLLVEFAPLVRIAD